MQKGTTVSDQQDISWSNQSLRLALSSQGEMGVQFGQLPQTNKVHISGKRGIAPGPIESE